MNRRLLSYLLLALPLAASAQTTALQQLKGAASQIGAQVEMGPAPAARPLILPPSDAAAAWTPVASCYYKVNTGQTDSGDPYLEGNITISSRGSEYKALLEDIRPEPAQGESTDVRVQFFTKAQIHELITDDSFGEGVFKWARLREDQIESAQAYDIGHTDDGSEAALLVFKDKAGKELAKGGAIGWFPIMCKR